MMLKELESSTPLQDEEERNKLKAKVGCAASTACDVADTCLSPQCYEVQTYCVMNKPKKTWHAKSLQQPKQETKLSGTGMAAAAAASFVCYIHLACIDLGWV
jgi:hypothetical protein